MVNTPKVKKMEWEELRSLHEQIENVKLHKNLRGKFFDLIVNMYLLAVPTCQKYVYKLNETCH